MELDPDQVPCYVGSDLGPTVCKGYQQSTDKSSLASKERVMKGPGDKNSTRLLVITSEI